MNEASGGEHNPGVMARELARRMAATISGEEYDEENLKKDSSSVLASLLQSELDPAVLQGLVVLGDLSVLGLRELFSQAF